MAETKKTAEKDPLLELVPYTAFKDDDKYKDDIYVAVNGRRFQIKRGEEVMIPRYVYNVLIQSQQQDKSTFKYMEQKASEYKNDSAKMG